MAGVYYRDRRGDIVSGLCNIKGDLEMNWLPWSADLNLKSFLWHFFGFGLIAGAFALILRPFYAALIASILGYLWECLDYYNGKKSWGIPFLANRPSKTDVLFDVIGALCFAMYFARFWH